MYNNTYNRVCIGSHETVCMYNTYRFYNQKVVGVFNKAFT